MEGIGGCLWAALSLLYDPDDERENDGENESVDTDWSEFGWLNKRGLWRP